MSTSDVTGTSDPTSDSGRASFEMDEKSGEVVGKFGVSNFDIDFSSGVDSDAVRVLIKGGLAFFRPIIEVS